VTPSKRFQGNAAELEYLLLTPWQRFKLWLFGQIYIGHKQQSGWTKSQPHYLRRCGKHGFYITHPHGWHHDLYGCEQCRRVALEALKRRTL